MADEKSPRPAVEETIIIGSGPAGWTAGLYTARANLNPLLITGNDYGGQVSITYEVENYPGFPEALSGPELVEKMKEQAEKFGLTTEYDHVSEIVTDQHPFIVRTANGKEYKAKSLILCTGARPRFLGVPGEKDFTGKGVSYCATCDGFFFRGKDLVVVGGGDSAVEEALFLTKFGTKVRIIHRRDELRASKILRDRAFAPLRDAVRFLADYMQRPDARGTRFGDDRYHIFPTVSPELHGLTAKLDRNADCLVDLTLTRFVFEAYQQAVAVLALHDDPACGPLLAEVTAILAKFPDYPTGETARGPVWVSVPGESPETVYNVPNPTTPVFPGEEVTLDSPPERLALARRSWQNERNEGGNELVFRAMQGARLGLLDLEKFKRQVAYCLQPNHTATDMALTVHGRYGDWTPFDFMARMGIWFENFGLPAVLAECLLQSTNGKLRLWPNWPAGKPASFRRLRTVGAFLVSAEHDGQTTRWVSIESEAGAQLTLQLPWPTGAKITRRVGRGPARTEIVTGDWWSTPTVGGELLSFLPA